MRPSGNALLNIATGIVTLCAVLVAGTRVRDSYLQTKRDEPAQPIHRSDWRSYAQGGVRMGPANAPVTIIEFADYQCPYCRKAASYLTALMAKSPRDVELVFRTYPVHEFAWPAAIAAQCAQANGKYWAFHDRLFAEPDSIGKKSWARFAADVGIEDSLPFNKCMASKATTVSLAADTIAARKLGVPGTPTFLINDLEVVGFPGAEAMDAYVQDALKHRVD